MGNDNTDICKFFENEIINDYFTANIKSEVIFDTMLTPLISIILSTILPIVLESEINGKIRLLAKEFPILKEDLEQCLKEDRKKIQYRSWNVDYLMCDNEFVYLVELKTTQGSVESGQMERYLNHIKKGKSFAGEEGWGFLCLLNNVSVTGKSSNKHFIKNIKKKCEENWYDALKKMFEEINFDSPKDFSKSYADRAKKYLVEKKATSSKKYLFTAGQILDCKNEVNGCEWWIYKKRKVIYLTPYKDEKVDKDFINVTFEIILKEKDTISERIEDSALRDYWDWVVSIIENSICRKLED